MAPSITRCGRCAISTRSFALSGSPSAPLATMTGRLGSALVVDGAPLAPDGEPGTSPPEHARRLEGRDHLGRGQAGQAAEAGVVPGQRFGAAVERRAGEEAFGLLHQAGLSFGVVDGAGRATSHPLSCPGRSCGRLRSG